MAPPRFPGASLLLWPPPTPRAPRNAASPSGLIAAGRGARLTLRPRAGSPVFPWTAFSACRSDDAGEAGRACRAAGSGEKSGVSGALSPPAPARAALAVSPSHCSLRPTVKGSAFPTLPSGGEVDVLGARMDSRFCIAAADLRQCPEAPWSRGSGGALAETTRRRPPRWPGVRATPGTGLSPVGRS